MHRSALVSSLLTAVLLAGCGSEDAATASSGVDDRAGASVASSAPTTSAPPVPVDDGAGDEPSEQPASTGDGSRGGNTAGPTQGAGLPGGEQPGGEQPVDHAPVDHAPVEEAPVEEAPVEEAPVEEAPVEEPTTVWPAEVTPVHGGRVWAVYLAVGSPDSDWDMHMLGETESYARGLGYVGSGVGSVGCDQGAAEALGFDPADNRVAVYFDSAARAQEFVAVYDRQDVGSARVTTYCLD